MSLSLSLFVSLSLTLSLSFSLSLRLPFIYLLIYLYLSLSSLSSQTQHALFRPPLPTHKTHNQHHYSTTDSCHSVWTAKALISNVLNGDSGCPHTTISTSDTDTVTLRFAVQNYEKVRADSDEVDTTVDLLRTLVHHIPLSLAFPKSVNVDTNVQIYSEVVTARALVEQVVLKPAESSGNDGTVTVKLFTSVQYPFQLKAPAIDGTQPSGLLYSAWTSVSDSNYDCEPTGGNCDQLWEFTITDNTNRCNFDGTYKVKFDIGCVEGYPEECPLSVDGERTVSVSLDLDTDTHCASVTQTVGFVSDLTSYTSNDFSQEYDQFIVDDTVYFRARVRSPDIALTSANWKTISISDTVDQSGSFNVDLMTGGSVTNSLSNTVLVPTDVTGQTDLGADPSSSDAAWLMPSFYLNLASADIPVSTRSTRSYFFSGVLDISYITSFSKKRNGEEEGEVFHLQSLSFVSQSESYFSRSTTVSSSLSLSSSSNEEPNESSNSFEPTSASNLVFVGVCVASLVAVFAALVVIRRRSSSSEAEVEVDHV